MPIEKQTIIDQIEVTRNGTIQVRFGLLLVEDGKEIDCKWHRTTLPPGVDVDAQLAAVDAHMAAMNKGRIDVARLPELKSIVQLVHTPARVKAFRDAVAAADAQEATRKANG
jgi:hypothetical protein